MESFARLLLWFLAVLCVVQLTTGGWSRLRTWLAVKFIGAPAAKAA